MTLTEKYKDLVALGGQLSLRLNHVTEGGGTLYISGTAGSQADKDAFLDKVKGYPSWQAEIVVEIEVA